MDELVIEDKKYISSKRAAQVTGYAKDYIGQLCREGRVPARLVGRNWYVLESALSDHRFKTPQKEENPSQILREHSAVQMTSGWENPRYEAISAKEMPSIKKIGHVESLREVEREESGTPAHLHEAWQAWFDHIASQPVLVQNTEGQPIKSEEIVETSSEEKPIEMLDKSENSDKENTKVHTKKENSNVSIKAIHHDKIRDEHRHVRRSVGIEDGGNTQKEEEKDGAWVHGRGSDRLSYAVPFQVVGTMVALIMAIFAGFSTGYFDNSIASLKPASLLAGVTMYQK